MSILRFVSVVSHISPLKVRNRKDLSVFSFVLLCVDITQHSWIVADLSLLSMSTDHKLLATKYQSQACQVMPTRLVYFDLCTGDRSVVDCPNSSLSQFTISCRSMHV